MVAIRTAERTERARQQKYFLPYQIDWILDDSPQSIWDKSRRIGATYAESYKAVRGCVRKDWPAVWFSSADEGAAREFILYCEQWVKVFDVAAQNLGEVIIDSEHDIKALVIEFTNGTRIHALRSNPKGFRSKGGKVVLDEFAHHDEARALYAAASPCVTWGFPISILSTHNGPKSVFNQILEDERRRQALGEPAEWSIHKTTLKDAVAQGLADKIAGRTLTEEERRAFLARQRKRCLDQQTYDQEYDCTPTYEGTAFLSYDLIATVEHPVAGLPELYAGGPCYVGIDVARRRNLFVIWVNEQVGDVFWNREVVAEHNLSFAGQDAELDRVMRTYHVVRVCIDQGGMGEKPVEDAKRRYGDYRVEGVILTLPVKQELAFGLKRRMEDRQVRVMPRDTVRDDLHAVKKITTTAGNVRFDAESTEEGHADRFWGAALADHAAGGGTEPRIRSLAPDYQGQPVGAG